MTASIWLLLNFFLAFSAVILAVNITGEFSFCPYFRNVCTPLFDVEIIENYVYCTRDVQVRIKAAQPIHFLVSNSSIVTDKSLEINCNQSSISTVLNQYIVARNGTTAQVFPILNSHDISNQNILILAIFSLVLAGFFLIVQLLKYIYKSILNFIK